MPQPTRTKHKFISDNAREQNFGTFRWSDGNPSPSASKKQHANSSFNWWAVANAAISLAASKLGARAIWPKGFLPFSIASPTVFQATKRPCQQPLSSRMGATGPLDPPFWPLVDPLPGAPAERSTPFTSGPFPSSLRTAGLPFPTDFSWPLSLPFSLPCPFPSPFPLLTRSWFESTTALAGDFRDFGPGFCILPFLAASTGRLKRSSSPTEFLLARVTNRSTAPTRSSSAAEDWSELELEPNFWRTSERAASNEDSLLRRFWAFC